MIYAEENRVTGRLTGRFLFSKNTFAHWTEYESFDEFNADREVDHHDQYHTVSKPNHYCPWCESEGWTQ